MAFRSYNNNQNTPVNTTYSSIVFSNPTASTGATKLSISYFNKLMKIAIAIRNNGINEEFATYDNDNAVVVYMSYTKAKILLNLINEMLNRTDMHNVCIELKNGLLKVSDGTEYGVNAPCISITYANDQGTTNEVIYQTKTDMHTGAYNYANGKYEIMNFNTIEIDTFRMCLEEYYKASSYAIAATVMEANMYKRNSEYELIKAIADEVGAKSRGGNPAGSNSRSFLGGNNTGNSNSNSFMNPPTNEYEQSTFSEIASGLD